MDQLLNCFSKLKLINVGEVKASFNRTFLVKAIRPETKWSNYEQVENSAKKRWRTELTSVEKDGDDLWLGVKGQSNLDIAGFLRNLFR